MPEFTWDIVKPKRIRHHKADTSFSQLPRIKHEHFFSCITSVITRAGERWISASSAWAWGKANASVDCTMLLHCSTARTVRDMLWVSTPSLLWHWKVLAAKRVSNTFLDTWDSHPFKNYEQEAIATGLFHKHLNPSTSENVRSNCYARMPIRTQWGLHWAHKAGRLEQFKQCVSMWNTSYTVAWSGFLVYCNQDLEELRLLTHRSILCEACLLYLGF